MHSQYKKDKDQKPQKQMGPANIIKIQLIFHRKTLQIRLQLVSMIHTRNKYLRIIGSLILQPLNFPSE